jgi:hypothetical protein
VASDDARAARRDVGDKRKVELVVAQLEQTSGDADVAALDSVGRNLLAVGAPGRETAPPKVDYDVAGASPAEAHGDATYCTV